MNSFGSGDSTRRNNISQKVHRIVHPYEAPILEFQRILVWENLVNPGIFMMLFHLCFAYVSYHSSHMIGIMFSFVMFLFWIDMWKHRIWPEIRATSPNEDDEWGELNPRLFTLREMCDILAEKILSVESLFVSIMAVRTNYPGKFCCCFSGLCVVLMFIGGRIPGVLIAYIFLMFLLLYPAVWYHKLLHRGYSVIQPFVVQFQHSFQQESSQAYQLCRNAPVSDTLIDDSDDDISEFLPVLNEKTAAVLATAMTDDSEHSETDEENMINELAVCSGGDQTGGVNNNESYLISLKDKYPLMADISDDENDNLGIPAATVPNPPPETNIFNSFHLPLNTNLIANVMSSVVEDAVSSFTKSLQTSESLSEDTTPTGSAASTPVSDFEFLDLINEEYD